MLYPIPRVPALPRLHAGAKVCRPLTWALTRLANARMQKMGSAEPVKLLNEQCEFFVLRLGVIFATNNVSSSPRPQGVLLF